MKNCYPLAKKILDREHYDVICLGRKLWDIDSYTFASSIRMTDKETIFLLLGWNRLTLTTDRKSSTDRVSSHSLAERRISQRTLPGAQPSWPGTSIPLHPHAGL